MINKLYIGNLNFKVTEGEITEYFSKCGTVSSVKLITDRETGRSRGFAFVEMSNQEEANEAMKLNDSEFQGRKLIVNEARERKPR